MLYGPSTPFWWKQGQRKHIAEMGLQASRNLTDEEALAKGATSCQGLVDVMGSKPHL